MKTITNISIILGSFLLISCGSEKKPETVIEAKTEQIVDANLVLSKAQSFFQKLPADVSLSETENVSEKVQLGKTLFFDNRLSMNNTQSCNSCHNLSTFGVDNKATSAGDLGKNGNRNSPTVLNAALHSSQFWDGRAKTVEEQAGMPILNPVEMNMPSEKFVVERLSKIAGYKKLFTEAFPKEKSPISYNNLKQAIGAFERTLITPNKFSKFLAGETTALNNEELRGLNDFIATGCTSCHNGKAVGGNMLQKFPLIGTEYKSLTGSTHEDLGKMEVTKDEGDKFMFKVPSLFNITETAPYFHDGSVTDLGKAISIMAKLQINKDLSDEQVNSIKAFLGSLKGDVPAAASIAPVMPQ